MSLDGTLVLDNVQDCRRLSDEAAFSSPSSTPAQISATVAPTVNQNCPPSASSCSTIVTSSSPKGKRRSLIGHESSTEGAGAGAGVDMDMTSIGSRTGCISTSYVVVFVSNIVTTQATVAYSEFSTSLSNSISTGLFSRELQAAARALNFTSLSSVTSTTAPVLHELSVTTVAAPSVSPTVLSQLEVSESMSV